MDSLWQLLPVSQCVILNSIFDSQWFIQQQRKMEKKTALPLANRKQNNML